MHLLPLSVCYPVDSIKAVTPKSVVIFTYIFNSYLYLGQGNQEEPSKICGRQSLKYLK